MMANSRIKFASTAITHASPQSLSDTTNYEDHYGDTNCGTLQPVGTLIQTNPTPYILESNLNPRPKALRVKP